MLNARIAFLTNKNWRYFWVCPTGLRLVERKSSIPVSTTLTHFVLCNVSVCSRCSPFCERRQSRLWPNPLVWWTKWTWTFFSQGPSHDWKMQKILKLDSLIFHQRETEISKEKSLMQSWNFNFFLLSSFLIRNFCLNALKLKLQVWKNETTWCKN